MRNNAFRCAVLVLATLPQGEMKPKVPNKDARGMALNPRVAFSAL